MADLAEGRIGGEGGGRGAGAGAMAGSAPGLPIPARMRAMVLTGHGDLDRYEWHEDWPVPVPGRGEVLVKVGATGLNNTDVNTRTGWYSRAVTEATTGGAHAEVGADDPAWGGVPVAFPRIQGADVCGRIVAVGDGVDRGRIGQRIIADCWLRDEREPDNADKAGYFGSERDGGFAEFCTMPSGNALAVECGLSDAELATFSCSYSTAEGMLERAGVTARDTVLVPGASGGVGGALVQLARRRGARVIAMASEAKHAAVAELGADRILPRSVGALRGALGEEERVSVVADVVGGPMFGALIDVLERRGRYVCSGAIAGPVVSLDLRVMYLRDLSLLGSTVIGRGVMGNVIRYIEAGELRPVLAASYPLERLREAQAAFIAKDHTGNIVVAP